MDIDGSVAVVTGGASGLGEATARALARRGARVAIFDLPQQRDRGEALAADIGGVFCAVDVSADPSVIDGFAAARAAFGQERILVNCAGVGTAIKTVSRSREDGSIKRFPLDLFERVVAINLLGTFRCIVGAAAGMLTLEPGPDGERGVIVNTASVAAHDGQAGQAAYAASKGGIVSMTLPIARDLMNEGIRINTILPGIFDTPAMARIGPKVKDALAASIPFPKRLGAPGEFAHMAVALVENGYANGECIRLDGAVRMAPR